MSEKSRKKEHVPEMMHAIRQHGPGEKLVYESMPVPEPGPGEVLVRMHASPVNPSDLALLKGGYLERDYPFVPGLEGSGVVVRSGSGFLAGLRMGKRVACTPDQKGDGTWAGYMKTAAVRVIPLPASVSFETGSMMLVNPMTAMAFMDIAKKGRHRAIVNNAASSALGRMLIRLANREGIPLISVVRTEADRAGLKELGAVHVLNSMDDSFEEDLRELMHQLGATLLLDAVTGQQTGVLLRAAPRGTTLIAYARLSGDPITVDPASLIREEKRMEGFLLGNWLEDCSIPFKLRFISRVKKNLNGSLASRVLKSVPVARAEEAIALYVQDMSAGKIILTMD